MHRGCEKAGSSTQVEGLALDRSTDSPCPEGVLNVFVCVYVMNSLIMKPMDNSQYNVFRCIKYTGVQKTNFIETIIKSFKN